MNPSRLDPCLEDFINRVIVPALVREYLAQSRKVEADNKITAYLKSTAMFATRFDRAPNASNEMQLLTVPEAAAALGIKQATVRAWILKRRITYVKIGRLVWVPAKDIKLLIERGTIPSRMPVTSRGVKPDCRLK
jgi:excisionase family DNA binding protein